MTPQRRRPGGVGASRVVSISNDFDATLNRRISVLNDRNIANITNGLRIARATSISAETATERATSLPGARLHRAGPMQLCWARLFQLENRE